MNNAKDKIGKAFKIHTRYARGGEKFWFYLKVTHVDGRFLALTTYKDCDGHIVMEEACHYYNFTMYEECPISEYDEFVAELKIEKARQESPLRDLCELLEEIAS